MSPKRIFIAVAAIVFVLAGESSVSHAEDGRVQITLFKAGRIVDGTGLLFYETKKYRLHIDHINSDVIHIKRIDLVGTVSNLQTAKEIVGTYTVVDAASAVVGHAKPARLQNAGGVILEVHGVNHAREFNLAGMIITSRELERHDQ
jgi:hypothetical protein